MLVRASILALALVSCAWFALGIRQAHDTDTASALIAAGTANPGQTAHADSLLRAAGKLNPDSEVDILRGRLALLETDRARAARIFADVTRREPQNIEGWVWLSRVARSVQEAGKVGLNLLRLDPRAVRGQQ